MQNFNWIRLLYLPATSTALLLAFLLMLRSTPAAEGSVAFDRFPSPVAPTTLVASGTITFAELTVDNDSPTHIGASTALTAVLSATVPLTYRWDFGDGDLGFGARVTHTYPAVGRYTATVTVSGTEPPITGTTLVQIIEARRVYLPAIYHFQPPAVKLGVHLAADIRTAYTSTDGLVADLTTVDALGSSWIRFDVPWHLLETVPGNYEWETLDVTIAEIVNAGLKPLPDIFGAPSWAADLDCGPISDIGSFEHFLDNLISRYADVVEAWEFTNEPDGRERHRWSPIIGCWGLHPEAYADQLGIFYRKVRQHDPRALVVAGGLAYDNWAIFERSFWPLTLAAGAGNYFDVANLHYYPINPLEFPTMAHKVNEIKEAMLANSVLGKQIWITETGMWVNLNGSVEAQKDFIVREQTRGFGAGVDNIFWFDPKERPLPPEQTQRWLFTQNRDPINGFETYRFFADKVGGTRSRGRITVAPFEIEAYRFTSEERELYIAWSNAGAQEWTLSSTLTATVSGRDGNALGEIPPIDGQVTIELDADPVYIEFYSAALRKWTK